MEVALSLPNFSLLTDNTVFGHSMALNFSASPQSGLHCYYAC